jgi:hypothetical protein
MPVSRRREAEALSTELVAVDEMLVIAGRAETRSDAQARWLTSWICEKLLDQNAAAPLVSLGTCNLGLRSWPFRRIIAFGATGRGAAVGARTAEDADVRPDPFDRQRPG